MYTREECIEESISYFNGDDMAANVWVDKYCLKDSKGNYLEKTPDDMHRRLAKEVARIELKYDNPMSEGEIYELFKDFKYIVPQGGSMYGIGNQVKASLSNCFVIGNGIDSYGGIMLADEEQAQLMKHRGGVGQDLSHIRPYGVGVDNSAISSSGVVPFMERYSNTTREVAQNGRNGALMLSIDIEHPDSERFIDAKIDTSKITGANVSIKASDQFMESVVSKSDYVERFNSIEVGKKSAEYMFNKMTNNAWRSAEPGVLYWTRVLNESPARGYGDEWQEKSTNPCGELPLPPYDSCRLIAINLFSYISNPFTSKAMLDQEKLFKHVCIAQRIIDDIIDLEVEKIDSILDKIEKSNESSTTNSVEKNLWLKIKQKAIDGRRTGLGYTGLGDMMAALGIRYGSEASINFISDIQQLFGTASYIASVRLAKERGAFPIWSYDKDQESDFIKRMFSKDNILMTDDIIEDYKLYGRRNIGNLTIAPTGTVSLMTSTTSGIEPLFAPYYFRKRKTSDKDKSVFIDEVGDMWEEYTVFHKPFIQWFQAHANEDSFEDAKKHISTLNEDELKELFEASPYYKATAQDVDYVNKVKMQGAAQKWVDHSISVTVNMPKDVTVETVKDVYIEAWKSGCKGVTIYRDGSRAGVLTTKKANANVEDFEYISAYKRPKTVDVDVHFKKALGDEYIFFTGLVNDRPIEIMGIPYNKELGLPRSIKKGKLTKVSKGVYKFVSERGFEIENIISLMDETEQHQTRSWSMLLRHRVNPAYIVKDIRQYASIVSFEKAVASVLSTYIAKDEGETCPQCKGEMVMTEGCKKCKDCGFAACG